MTTVIIQLSLVATLFCCAPPVAAGEGFGRCLPDGIDLNSVVVNEAQQVSTKPAGRQTTVKQRLIQLKAHCRRGKLMDGKGRQIYLYELIGCWGNPPDDYLELLKHQEQEIERLKKRYTVIQIPCAQGVDPRTISRNSR